VLILDVWRTGSAHARSQRLDPEAVRIHQTLGYVAYQHASNLALLKHKKDCGSLSQGFLCEGVR